MDPLSCVTTIVCVTLFATVELVDAQNRTVWARSKWNAPFVVSKSGASLYTGTATKQAATATKQADEAAIERAKLTKQAASTEQEVRADRDTFSTLLARNNQRLRRLDSPASPFCPAITKDSYPDPSTWKNLVDTYCPGYSDISLTDDNLVVLALVYADDVSAEQVPMLQDQGRYAVVDDCPTKTFVADDVSLQVVDGENLFVILLDSTSPNGYLRKELPECGNWNTPTAFPRIYTVAPSEERAGEEDT